MKKLRCESCGGELKVEDNNEYAYCNYCRTRYKLNEDKTIVIKVDDSIAEVTKNASKIALPIFIMISGLVLLFVGFFIYSFIEVNKSDNTFDYSKRQEEIDKENNEMKSNFMYIYSNVSKESKETDKQINNSFEKKEFNNLFETSKGTLNTYLIQNLVDEVIETNKKGKHPVTVIYNNKSFTKENDLNGLKKKLTKSQYDVSYGYDKEGFINKMTIK